MKQAMKEMLQEFIERDFSAYEMQMVIGAITDVEQDYKIIASYRKRDDVEMVVHYKYELQMDMFDLREQLDNLGLTYDVKDLVDDGGVEV